MKNISLIFSLCFANFFCFASNTNDYLKLPDSITIIVKEIAHSNVFEESNQVGIAGSPSQQNLRLKQLKQLASVSKLSELTKNKSAIVRLYSFIALLDKQEPVSSEIQARMLNDKTIVSSINGCIGSDKSVGSIVNEIVSHRNKSKI